MKIQAVDKRWKKYLALAAGLLTAALMFIGNLHNDQWPAALLCLIAGGMGAAVAAALALRVRVSSRWVLPVMHIALATAGILLLHLSIEAPITVRAYLYDLFLLTGLQMALMSISGSIKISGSILLSLCTGFGLVNQAVKQFRGSCINFSDFYAIDTALSVAGNYAFEINMAVIMTLLLYACCMALLMGCKFECRMGKGLPRRLFFLVLAAALVYLPVSRADGLTLYYWGTQGARNNGVLMQLLVEMQSTGVSAPEGYSSEKASALLESADKNTGTHESRPHIIAIMNEAYSDLSVLGEFETSADVMDTYNRLRSESTHGYAISSVYGGSTATSEWEYLTGNTMAFLPANTVPYRLYVDEDTVSLVDILQNQGYRCLAMHPYEADGWSRDYIYPQLGFEESYFLDDLPWGDTVRDYVSDSAFVDQVISLFEQNAPEEPLFLFGITMQNHGGYKYEGFEADVHLSGLQNAYPEAEQFLSLMKLSDEALGKLVDYFRSVDEEVVIVMFGDHQPRLSMNFYAEIGAEDNRLASVVPFIIWRNFDSTSREIPVTSLNYLSALTLEAAGADLPPYQRYLLDLREKLPALNSQFCVDAAGNAVSIRSAESETAALLEDYRMLQYANIFDSAADRRLFAGKLS